MGTANKHEHSHHDHDHKNHDHPHGHTHANDHSHDHDHSHGEGSGMYTKGIITLVLLLSGILLDYLVNERKLFLFFQGYVRLTYYLIPYLLIGWGVIKQAWNSIFRGDLFNEFFLMSVATLGAFYIGEYPEGVTVMLFYQVGELFQEAAVNKAKKSIKALLDVRPDTVTVIRDQISRKVNPSGVQVGEIIQVKAGERVALDGVLASADTSFNTAALTGESKPQHICAGETVLAGMINLNVVSEIKVTTLYKDSKLSRILQLTQEATSRKAKTQLFISRFAKIYTPIVVFLAIGITLLPYFFVESYVFNNWLYRALVFLVISCPCALVISIPLGYFGGIGLGSRNGILFKGATYLDIVTQVNTVVMDKTGTLTKGVFSIQKIETVEVSQDFLLEHVAALEAYSTHPVAKAIMAYQTIPSTLKAEKVEEIPGYGLKGIIAGKEVLAGNDRLMNKYNISVLLPQHHAGDTIIHVAINGKYTGHFIIADELKDDAVATIQALKTLNIKTVMLSGDKQKIVEATADVLKIEQAYGELLPEDKAEKVEAMKQGGARIAFVGDGINDAPVLALADVGISMGGLGSDAAIEASDVVIQNNQPSKIITAIQIGKITRNIVWQNIGFAFGVKCIVLVLGAFGVANLWEAVFADVGVALLAILNAVRIQNKKLNQD